MGTRKGHATDKMLKKMLDHAGKTPENASENNQAGGTRRNKRIERIPGGEGLAKSWEHVYRSVKVGAVLRGQRPMPEPSKMGA